TKIFLCEGETDAIALLDAGAEKNDPAKLVVAVPSASTFNEKWARLFTGKDVLLCFDNDAAGNAAVDRVGKFLQGHARTIRAIGWWASITFRAAKSWWLQESREWARAWLRLRSPSPEQPEARGSECRYTRVSEQ